MFKAAEKLKLINYFQAVHLLYCRGKFIHDKLYITNFSLEIKKFRNLVYSKEIPVNMIR